MKLIWDKKVKRYRDARGRFAKPKWVLREVDKGIDTIQREMDTLTRRLINREITLADWQAGTRDILKASHTLYASVGRGGYKQMTQSDWGRVGALTRRQYEKLNGFANDIERGKLRTFKQISNRSGQYLKAVRVSYYVNEQRSQIEAGKTQCARILRAAESCVECIAWSKKQKGFVDIQEMPPIGTLLCGQFCKCYFEYR